MAIKLRSATTTEGRRMAGARSLWRANGMTEEQIGKPVIGSIALTEKVVVTSGFTDTVLPVYAPGDHDQLSVDTSFITAWSNDFGFDGIFARQIETLGEEGDVLICYSTSGSSKNIIQAVAEAKRKKMHVLAYTGNSKENKLVAMSDHSFVAPSSKTAMIQEMHTIVGHEVCLSVERSIARD